MEQDIYSGVLSEYLKEGGDPTEAVNILSESYIGVPSMCNLTAESANFVGLNSQTILLNAVRQMLTQKFDPKRCDALFMKNDDQTPPEWLDAIVQDTHWRQTIYELMEMHPRSVFLNFVVLRIAESGYASEVSALKTASIYVKIYNYILGNSIAEKVSADDLELKDSLPEFLKLCCEREETYLYAQLLIRKLYDEFNGLPFLKLARQLENAAARRGHSQFVEHLRTYMSDAPLQLSKAFNAILSKQAVTPGDVMVIHRFYTSSNPPASRYICNYEFIGHQLDQDMLERVIYIIAYATTFKESSPKEDQKEKIDKVCTTLKALHGALKDPKGVNFRGSLPTIVQSRKIPIASLAILHWIEHLSLRTPYYETYYRTSVTPLPHLLLDEIANENPLQQPVVFEIVKRCLLHDYQNFAPEILMTLRTNWIDRLLNLVALDFTMPVLKFMKEIGPELDRSLSVHFVKNLLEIAKPPCSAAFIEYFADIVASIPQMSTSNQSVQEAVDVFFEEAISSSDGLSAEIKAKVARARQRGVKRVRGEPSIDEDEDDPEISGDSSR
ncbi:Negative elongation factor C/D [Apophysomyces ossiformis]|uniref:Negative elongation factor C/D n=1 Tax=Apophysomyces ossiformis TaxID=679940 RepID=A0A8H7BLZ6_9FUNG|nr:Negative elongation factor C/D [Apophysomyces ossiformis]